LYSFANDILSQLSRNAEIISI